MDVDLKNMSDINKRELFTELKARRNKVRVPDKLEVLTIKFIVRNFSVYMNIVENPFNNLSNLLVQKILLMIKETRNEISKPEPEKSDDERKLVLMLLNPNVTEFDCIEFKDGDSNFSHSNNEIYYRHILENCPRMIKVTKDYSFDYQPSILVNDLQSWPNLKHIYFKDYLCSDESMRQIQENCPLLEAMEFCISPELFTMEGVESLSNMKHLKYLFIEVAGSVLFPEKTIVTELLVHAAGRVPNLVKFDFDLYADWHSDFVQLYGERYPNKNIIIRQIELLELKIQWPLCLSVEQMTLEGRFSSARLEDLVSLPTSVRELRLDGVASSSVINTVLQKLGPELTKLELKDNVCEHSTPIDMYKVLAACPKLENFLFSSTTPVMTRSNSACTLPSDYFLNFKSFRFSSTQEGPGSQSELLNLWRLFLLGSGKYERNIAIGCETQLNVLLNVLQSIPTCLDQLEMIEFDFYEPDMLVSIVEVAKLLILRSPFLEKVKFGYRTRQAAWDNWQDHSWFEELVDSVAVEFSGLEEVSDSSSSYEDHDEFDDSSEYDQYHW